MLNKCQTPSVNYNENHIKQLFMNQISIVDATLNVLKQDEENMEEMFNNIDNQLSEIACRLQENEKEQNHQFTPWKN